jgi:hypothetical protein
MMPVDQHCHRTCCPCAARGCLLLQYVEKLKAEILENLRHLSHAPGVGFAERPPDGALPDYEPPEVDVDAGGAATNPMLERLGKYAREHGIARENELYEDDHDHYGD